MNLKTLRYFLMIAEKENITMAAKELGLSQPSLSRQLQSLEEELGAKLFVRAGRKMLLTEEGVMLSQRGEQLLYSAEQIEKDIRDAKGKLSGELHLIGAESYMAGKVSSAVKRFREEHPEVECHITTAASEEAMRCIRTGQSEIGFVRRYEELEEFEMIDLEVDSWVAVIPKEHPLAQMKGDTVCVKDLAAYDLLLPIHKGAGEMIRGAFLDKGYIPKIVARVEPHFMNMECAAEGLGIALVLDCPSIGRYQDVTVAKKIVDFPIPSTVSMIYRRYYGLSSVAKAFVSEYMKYADMK